MFFSIPKLLSIFIDYKYMIRKQYYFLSMFTVSAVLALLVSLHTKEFLLIFLTYTALFFIVGVSITVFPFVYYNHFSEMRILSKIHKSLPDQIVNIIDARARFNVSVKDQKFDVIPGLMYEKYIDAKAVFVGNYIEFYQYSHPYVLSYIPFLKIDLRDIREIGQGRNRYSIMEPDLPSLVKCNYFDIYTDTKVYRMIVLHVSTGSFIGTIVKFLNS